MGELIRYQLSKSEITDTAFRCMIQLGFEFNNSSVVEKVVEKLQRSVIGLHLKLENGTSYVYTQERSPLIKIPNQVRDLQRAASWVAKHSPDLDVRAGSIGYNDSKVVLNISHICSDGAYFKFLTETLFDPPPAQLPYFPQKISEIFQKQMAQAGKFSPPWDYDSEVTRIHTHHKQIEHPSDESKYETLRFKASDLKCFNQKTQKLEGLTEYLWLSLILAGSLHNGHLDSSVGCTTCVDLRSLLEPKAVDYSICNCFSTLTATSPISPSLLLKDVGLNLRKDLERRRKRFDEFGRLKYYNADWTGPKYDGTCLEVTNMGPLKIRKPIVDAWASLTARGPSLGNIMSVMSFSVIGEDRNDVVVRLRYGNHFIGEDEAFRIAKTMNHFLRNISLERSVGSALDELKEIH